MHTLDTDQAADPAVQAVQDAYETELDAELDQVIGRTAATWGDVTAEAEALTAQGFDVRDLHDRNFVAEVMRDRMDADVGLINSGGVRADFRVDDDITRRDVLAMLPFPNTVILVELTGEQLVALMEGNFHDDDRDLYYHIAGVRKIANRDLPSGERVWHLEVDGAPVDPEATYTVATIDFLLGRGEAYAALHDGTMLIDAQAGPLLSQEVMGYIEDAEVVDARVDGRLALGAASLLATEP
jgi:5'-nucleotidase / UDP-sugar diphosphatase